MKVSCVEACAIQNWHGSFERVTIPCKLVKLTEDFIAYLQSDKIILPKGWDYTNEGDEVEFGDLLQEVRAALSQFHGAVFPKLNWSAPKDAYYMICGGSSLKCTHPSDVIHLLKASEFITHDLIAPYQSCIDKSDESPQHDVYLALKRWDDINPGHELRCFVRDNTLIAVTQRHTDLFFENLERDVASYVELVKRFFLKQIKEKFSLSEYVFDVCIANDGRKCVLIDFNVFSPEVTTDLGMFDSWDELTAIDTGDESKLPLVAFVDNQSRVKSSSLEQYARPIDIDQIAGFQGNLFDFLEQVRRQQEAEDSSDEEDEA